MWLTLVQPEILTQNFPRPEVDTTWNYDILTRSWLLLSPGCRKIFWENLTFPPKFIKISRFHFSPDCHWRKKYYSPRRVKPVSTSQIPSLQTMFKWKSINSVFNSWFDSPAPWKSPCVSGARGSTEILNIARSARTPVNFRVWNPQEINFTGSICSSQEFTKIMIFHEIHEFSSPRGWPWGRSNFLPEIFWKLSCSESESSCIFVGLDKRKLKTTDRISSTDQKCEIFQPKKSAQILTKLAPPP